MRTYDEYLSQIEAAIASIEYPAQPEALYAPISYTMQSGGKRLRPVLTLMACEALGIEAAKALEPALGIELFHNFTLLHDDVMDRADVRRGRPTVHRKWNDNVAILSGDAMLTLATQHIADAPSGCAIEVMHLFNRTAMEIYEGQQWDMDFEHRDDVTVEEYMEMIRLKTSVLLGCAAKTGAMVAHALTDYPSSESAEISKENAMVDDAFYQMGVNLGLAFQLQDDYLDVWGDPETFGKEIGGDIMNNKKTFLLINALNIAEGDTALELRHWLHDEFAIRDEKVAAVTRIYEELGLKQLAIEAINAYSAKALDALRSARLQPQDYDAFAALITSLVKREK